MFFELNSQGSQEPYVQNSTATMGLHKQWPHYSIKNNIMTHVAVVCTLINGISQISFIQLWWFVWKQNYSWEQGLYHVNKYIHIYIM